MKNSIEEDMRILERIDVKYFMSAKIEQSDYMIDKADEVNNAIDHILSDYKRVLKENERYKKSDYETICLENNELREITDRIQSEYNDLLKDNFKLKNELETKRKEYQETYKDVREELKELKKENEIYKKNSEIMSKENLSTARKRGRAMKVFLDDIEAIETVLSMLEEQDKIIDIMAEQLAGLAIFDIDKDDILILEDKEEVKQYFKDKVKGKE